ncbi:hypothetical protein Tco_1114955, partial [Tanacetum coccineum]
LLSYYYRPFSSEATKKRGALMAMSSTVAFPKKELLESGFWETL